MYLCLPTTLISVAADAAKPSIYVYTGVGIRLIVSITLNVGIKLPPGDWICKCIGSGLEANSSIVCVNQKQLSSVILHVYQILH